MAENSQSSPRAEQVARQLFAPAEEALYGPGLKVRTLTAIADHRLSRGQRWLMVCLAPALLAVASLFYLLPAWLLTIPLRWLGTAPAISLLIALVITYTAGAAFAGLMTAPLLRHHLRSREDDGVL